MKRRNLPLLLFFIFFLGFFSRVPLCLSEEEYFEIKEIISLGQEDCEINNFKYYEPIAAKKDSTRIFREKIEEIAENFLLAEVPWEKNRVEIKNIEVSKIPTLPPGEITYEIIPPRNGDFLGHTRFFILLKSEERWERKIGIRAEVRVSAPVVLTARRLKSRQIITEGDVFQGEMDLSRAAPGVISDINEVLGKRTKTAINANIVLRSGLVETPPLIKRGDIVSILAESDSIKVATLGEARENGRKREKIKVRNIASKKDVFAVVVDSKTVKVEL